MKQGLCLVGFLWVFPWHLSWHAWKMDSCWLFLMEDQREALNSFRNAFLFSSQWNCCFLSKRKNKKCLFVWNLLLILLKMLNFFKALSLYLYGHFCLILKFYMYSYFYIHNHNYWGVWLIDLVGNPTTQPGRCLVWF